MNNIFKNKTIRPDLLYAKPLYYMSLVSGSGCIINPTNFRVGKNIYYNIYCICLILISTFAPVISLRFKINYVYPNWLSTTATLEGFQYCLIIVINVHTISNHMTYGRKHLEDLFNSLKIVDVYLLPEAKQSQVKNTFKKVFYISNITFIIFCICDCVAFTLSIPIYNWFFHNSIIVYSIYLNSVAGLQVFTLVHALKHRFAILNRRLEHAFSNWPVIYDKQSWKKDNISAQLTCIVKSYDLLCDCIESVNSIFGYNILALIIVAVVRLLYSANVVVTIGTRTQGIHMSFAMAQIVLESLNWFLWHLMQSILVIWICHKGSTEARKPLRIVYNILSRIPFKSDNPEEFKLRNGLQLLTHEIEHRNPRFKAAGVFPVDYTLLSAMLSTATSYFVIILQFDTSKAIIHYTSEENKN